MSAYSASESSEDFMFSDMVGTTGSVVSTLVPSNANNSSRTLHDPRVEAAASQYPEPSSND